MAKICDITIQHSLSAVERFLRFVRQLQQEINHRISTNDDDVSLASFSSQGLEELVKDASQTGSSSGLAAIKDELKSAAILRQTAHTDPQIILPQQRLKNLVKSCSVLVETINYQTSKSPGRLPYDNINKFRAFWTCPRRVRALCRKLDFVSAEFTELVNVLGDCTGLSTFDTGSAQAEQPRDDSVHDREGLHGTSQEHGKAQPFEETTHAVIEERHLSEKTEILQEFFLDRLAFQSMTEREEEVSTAHSSTFEWMFSDRFIAFRPWLERRNDDSLPLFWITGKAGSGKSTLLRFLANHSETQTGLSIWAGSNSLLRANFYFWTSGTPEQRSLTGLLRYVVWQLACQNKDIISHAFPALWKTFWSMSTRQRIMTPVFWNINMLRDALKTTVTYATKSSCCICLFIDGLDELEGSHDDMVKFLGTLATHGQSILKIVLSSRPWSAFSNAFKKCPGLELQDLTAKDLRNYFADRLSAHDAFSRKQENHVTDLAAVIKECMQKANGVFLWAEIVTSRMLSEYGMLSADQLLLEVCKLPTDLDELYTFLLFKSKSSDEQISACRILRILRAREDVCESILDDHSSSVTLWDLALASHFSIKNGLETRLHKTRQDDVRKMCRLSESLIAKSCANLLRIYERDTRHEGNRMLSNDNENEICLTLSHRKVNYLHRTFRDFLTFSGIWDTIIDKSTGDAFEPHLSNLLSITLQFKFCFENPRPHRKLNDWYPRIALAMTHARLSTGLEKDEIIQALLLDMDKTLTSLWRRRPFDEGDSWSRSCFGSFEEREKNKSVVYAPFESLATKYGVESLIKCQIQSGLPLYTAGRPLLSHAIEFLFSRRSTVFPLSSPEMIRTLLAHGLDPNANYVEFSGSISTPWKDLLKHVREALRREWIDEYDTSSDGLPRWSKIVCAFILAGADLNASLDATQWDTGASTTRVFEHLYEHCACQETEDILRKIADSSKP